ncbi:hypothetical protein GRX01_13545 [Halobaculum sp. WSA2]|uniref:Uncharacterized protein n=1 Tax=Halobaculum saliterrae TaxID=2073113 RepID=A0A6B0STR8_9EURY|nr:hypothetical protein [Halobaculum saliterrae]MXR42358.1 hypothetical protein [Halobaculum saliterrae]
MTGTTDDPGSDGATIRGPESTLSAALAELDDGCSVLVTGDVSDEAYRVASSRYFGAPHRRRQRVLALTTGGAEAPDAWLPDGVDAADDDAAVVRLDGAVRDPTVASGSDASATDAVDPTSDVTDLTSDVTDPTSAASGTEPDAGPDRIDLDGAAGEGGTADGDAAAVRAELLDAIDEVDEDRPARLGLRVGVFRVDMLCATLGADATGSLLREVSRATHDRGGMAHFHLPRPVGGDPRSDSVVAEFVELLDDDLDVIVELRCRETASAPEERWHIIGWGTTEWNALR